MYAAVVVDKCKYDWELINEAGLLEAKSNKTQIELNWVLISITYDETIK